MDSIYEAYDSIAASSAFKSRMVQTLQQKYISRERAGGFAIKRRTLAILIAAAVTVLAIGTAAAATIIARKYYSPSAYLMQGREEREQNQSTVPDVESAIASAKPESGAFRVVMLPEMENAAELNEWRQKMGQPVYSEQDWGWIRDIRPEIEEVLVDGHTLAFNVRLNTDHGKSFDLWYRTDDGQRLDAACDGATVSFEKNGRTVEQFVYTGTGIHPDSVSEAGATLGSEIELADLSEPLPTDGKVHVTMQIGIRDAKVDDMADIGLLAAITYSFGFDASAGADAAAPVVTARMLSGSVVLTETDENGNEFNKRVSLDGVVLTETLHYRSTGVYVTYTLQSAPDGWTDADTRALLQPSFESPSHYGLSVVCAKKGADAALTPGHSTGAAAGEYVCILPIFPADYETIEAADYEIRIGCRYVSAYNDSPVGEDWRLPVGADGYDLSTTDQPIASFALPLP